MVGYVARHPWQRLFPKYDPKKEYWLCLWTTIASGSLASATALFVSGSNSGSQAPIAGHCVRDSIRPVCCS
jgi:hypothetical protein